MVDDTVDFEQRYFLRMMSSNSAALDLPKACAWSDGLVANGGLQERNGESRMTLFVKSIIDLVLTTTAGNFPLTFMFDDERLRILQSDLQSCVCQEACIQIMRCIVHQGGRVDLPSRDCDRLLKRIISVVGPDTSRHSWARNASAVALEILRAVYELRNFEGLPDETLLEEIEARLQEFWDLDSAAYGGVEDHLYPDLKALVKQEIEAVEHLTPLQILNYCSPGPYDSSAEENNEPLLSIARRIAHIGVLHWRVWAPILYEQQHPNGFSRLAVGSAAVNLPNGAAELSKTRSGSLREDWPRDTVKGTHQEHETPTIFKHKGLPLEDDLFENRSDQSELTVELSSCSISVPKS